MTTSTGSRGALAGPTVPVWLRPVRIRGRVLPPAVLLVLAAVGGAVLLAIAWIQWRAPTDEAAYWRAAQRLIAGAPVYDPSAPVGQPYAFWYPPVLAQVLSPFTRIFTEAEFSIAWTVLMLACLWWIAGRSVTVGLALVCFTPVALELWSRNVHLILAALIVLALRRSWAFWIPAAAIKMTPILGVLYLAAGRKYRQAALTAVLGAAVLAVSVALSPGAWEQFLQVGLAKAAAGEGSYVAIPFVWRFAAGALLALVAGRFGGTRGEILLVVALTLANPTAWLTALSILVAILPLVRDPLPVQQVSRR